MKNLSPAQIKFCQKYIDTSNATISWMHSHPDANYSTAKSEGCKILNNPDVKSYIDQLKEEMATTFKQTKDGTIKDLIISAEEAKEAKQFSAYAKIREMIIKMVGFYEPDKLDVTTNGEGINKINITIVKSSEELEDEGIESKIE